MGNHRASVLILMAYIGNSTNFRKSLSIFNSWSFKPSYSMMFCPKYHGQTPGDLLHQTDITLQNSTNSRLPFHKTHGHQFFLYLFKTLMEAIKIWSVGNLNCVQKTDEYLWRKLIIPPSLLRG